VSNRLQRWFLTVVFALSIPSIAVAQAPGSPAEGAEIQALFDELQRVHLQLEEIQMRALQDPQLSAEQAQLGERIQAAMEQTDPTLANRIARAEALETEAMTAQQAGNAQRLEELVVEAQAIQQHFMTVQQQVLGQPAIAQQLTTFQTRLESKMLEVDPAAATLISRFREIEDKLSEVMAGA
jgi:hypothetical protein